MVPSKRASALLLTALSLSGCVGSLGSHMILGTPRPATDPDKMVLYTAAPAHSEVIAQVSARSTVRADDAGETAQALEKLKEEAAEVGANGVVMQMPVGPTQPAKPAPSTAPATAPKPGALLPPARIGDYISHNRKDVTLSGLAIYVPETP